MTISVIIPTFNEEKRLGECLHSVQKLQPLEIIVSDGGSDDNTVMVAKRHNAKVIQSPKGRGIQLHRGAQASSGEVLLFLHADGRLDERLCRNDIEQCISEGYCGGFFTLLFEDPRPTLRLVEFFANLRARLFQLPYGDQAIFLTRDAYEEVGGFRDYPFLEDLDMAIRLRKKGYRLKALQYPVIVSARRFGDKGFLRPIIKSLRNVVIASLFMFGVSPYRLIRLYK